jgi:hypothetical protein
LARIAIWLVFLRVAFKSSVDVDSAAKEMRSWTGRKEEETKGPAKLFSNDDLGD